MVLYLLMLRVSGPWEAGANHGNMRPMTGPYSDNGQPGQGTWRPEVRKGVRGHCTGQDSNAGGQGTEYKSSTQCGAKDTNLLPKTAGAARRDVHHRRSRSREWGRAKVPGPGLGLQSPPVC